MNTNIKLDAIDEYNALEAPMVGDPRWQLFWMVIHGDGETYTVEHLEEMADVMSLELDNDALEEVYYSLNAVTCPTCANPTKEYLKVRSIFNCDLSEV